MYDKEIAKLWADVFKSNSHRLLREMWEVGLDWILLLIKKTLRVWAFRVCMYLFVITVLITLVIKKISFKFAKMNLINVTCFPSFFSGIHFYCKYSISCCEDFQQIVIESGFHDNCKLTKQDFDNILLFHPSSIRLPSLPALVINNNKEAVDKCSHKLWIWKPRSPRCLRVWEAEPSVPPRGPIT